MSKIKTIKKYKLTDETIKSANGGTLYRIKALRNFGKVKKGELGGFVESELNLSHNGDCWILGNARVSDTASISGNTVLFDNAQIYGNLQVGSKPNNSALIKAGLRG